MKISSQEKKDLEASMARLATEVQSLKDQVEEKVKELLETVQAKEAEIDAKNTANAIAEKLKLQNNNLMQSTLELTE